jgi:hypothetical protein
VLKMNSAQERGLAKLVRQAYVHGIYQWFIGLVFLFSAFSAFPEYKWPIGLGLLLFSAGVGSIVHVVRTLHETANLQADAAERKTRHSILRAAELAAGGQTWIAEADFWAEVDRRVEAEGKQSERMLTALADLGERTPTDVPVGFWKGLMLGGGALVWQLAANLLGIALIAGLTPG